MTTMDTIDDFEVRIAGEDRVVAFTSVARGELARFPAWEHADRDLRHFVPGDIPTGSRAEPFVDGDEGRRITIFESGGHVYVHENDGDGFRVRLELHFEAWVEPIAPS